MKIINDESELPYPPTRLWQYFIRSLIEPTVLIEGYTGDCFKRKDGKRWKQPAIERSAKLDERGIADWEKLSPRAAWFDDAVYPYEPAAVAA